ncbi:MOS1T transposase, partial [Pseudoatta argentina]
MSIFVPNKVYLRGILLHYFIKKKSAADAHRILVQTYGDNALSDTTCRDWFRRFKNNDFELEDKERSGAPKKFQDKELEQLLDTSIDVFESSLKRKTAAIHDKVILLHDNARPHVAKPVKTYLETLKWDVLPHPPYSPDIAPSDFHLFKSAADAHRILVQTYGDNALSDTTCRDWFRRFKNNDFELEDKERSGAPKKFQDKELEQLLDEKYYKLMSQLITGDRYRLQLMRLSRALKEKRPLYAQRHDKVISLHDNARPHVAKPVKTYLETLK